MGAQIAKVMRFPASVRAQLNELAYQERTTPSAVIREIISTYCAVGIDGMKLGVPSLEPGAMGRMNMMFDYEDWMAAEARATAENVALPELIRRAVIARTAEITLPA